MMSWRFFFHGPSLLLFSRGSRADEQNNNSRNLLNVFNGPRTVYRKRCGYRLINVPETSYVSSEKHYISYLIRIVSSLIYFVHRIHVVFKTKLKRRINVFRVKLCSLNVVFIIFFNNNVLLIGTTDTAMNTKLYHVRELTKHYIAYYYQ